MPNDAILSLSCADRPGIVAGVSARLLQAGCNITEAHQYNDPDTALFFMRARFTMLADDTAEALTEGFKETADGFGMKFTIRSIERRQRVVLLTSKLDHCLSDILYRWRSGEIMMDVAGIISNHPRETYAHLDFKGIPFHYLPVTRPTKIEQEAQIWELIRDGGKIAAARSKRWTREISRLWCVTPFARRYRNARARCTSNYLKISQPRQRSRSTSYR